MFHFWGSTRQAPPYPSAKLLRCLVASLRLLTGNPLVGLSSLSFSWRLFSNRPRVLSFTRSPSSPKKNSRRRTTLNEPDECFTRIARRLWSEPRVRISRIAAPSPLQMLQLESMKSASSLSWSPRVQCAGRAWEWNRISRLSSKERLCLLKPSSNSDEPLSWHPALRTVRN